MRDLKKGLALLSIVADKDGTMADKRRQAGFDEILSRLAGNGFTVAAATGSAEGRMVSKGGAAAVLVPAPGGGAAYAVHPGVLIRGEVARLVDRGYQKFLTTAEIELPATASQLQAIHRFSEELTQQTGGISLYNESLGTTSDLYLYDRLKGREEHATRAARPWELDGGH